METIFLPSKMHFAPGAVANESILTIEPLHHGYGTTVGNSLRRVLLSSLPGAAVTAMKIKGVQHEFSTVPGVKEDVLDIMLNIKKLRMRVHSEEPVVLKLATNKVGVVTAAAIEKNADVEIANPELEIATITDAKTPFDMEITVSRGRGYVPTEERDAAPTEIGVIAVDAMFSPVRNVGFRVENTRVGEITNYDKLIMNIETDGTINPEEAVTLSAQLLIDHVSLLLNKPSNE